MLAMHAIGENSGLVLDSGDSITSAVPIIEGEAIKGWITKGNIGGCNVTDMLGKSLYEKWSKQDENAIN